MPDGAGPSPVLTLEHASKSFGAVKALEDASIELYPREVHALLGENGAGKSTLVKILAGLHQPDRGTLTVGGAPVNLNGPAAARDAGIAVIYQEPNLFPDLSVAENVFMGRHPLRSGRRVDTRAMERQVASIFERLGVKLDPGRVARGLSVADQQIVEIAKALSLDARVIVMDEPTAALSAFEVERLFRVITTLSAQGAAVLFISHRLEEIFAICRTVTVMRDGRHVFSGPIEGMTSDELVRAMVGRDIVKREGDDRAVADQTVLVVERLTREGVFTDISFSVHAGEILALAGLVGAGRSEVARAIFGIDRYDAGSVTVAGAPLRKAAPSTAMASGIGFVPEDRRQLGLVMSMATDGNIALASMDRLSRYGLLRKADERRFATEWAARLRMKYGRISDPISTLSGGNQQKAVLAKWLSRHPQALIVDEPTRGIDVSTKAEVHRLLIELAKDGVGILMISSELPEVLHLADRILVMREGRLVTEISRQEASEEVVLAAATGQRQLVGD